MTEIKPEEQGYIALKGSSKDAPLYDRSKTKITKLGSAFGADSYLIETEGEEERIIVTSRTFTSMPEPPEEK